CATNLSHRLGSVRGATTSRVILASRRVRWAGSLTSDKVAGAVGLLARLQESAKWYFFAMSADDRRRERFSTVISRLRGRTVETRRAAQRSLDDVNTPSIEPET